MRKWDFTKPEAKAEFERRVRSTMETSGMDEGRAQTVVAMLMWDEQTEETTEGVEKS